MTASRQQLAQEWSDCIRGNIAILNRKHELDVMVEQGTAEQHLILTGTGVQIHYDLADGTAEVLHTTRRI